MHVDPSSHFEDLEQIVKNLEEFKSDEGLKANSGKFAILVEKNILTGCLYSRKLSEHGAIHISLKKERVGAYDFKSIIDMILHSNYLYTQPQCLDLGIDFKTPEKKDRNLKYNEFIKIFSKILAARQ
ncbi:MAG: hypothetical protein SGJ17_14955 [Hyphomicrobiales bacterium]|nr:hypothetical protein [Hyphomicrobiales bacterium]